MPDKHEVGGSSPLGPTKNFHKRKQMKILIIHSSLFILHHSLNEDLKRRRDENGEEKTTTFYGGVAQLGEHLPCKQGVMGSNPIISTNQVRKITY